MFSDYGHGLKLAGLHEFRIGPEIINDPKEALNALIKSYYNQRE